MAAGASGEKVSREGIDLGKFVEETQGFRALKIAESCRLATMTAPQESDFAESGLVVKMKHLRDAIIMVRNMNWRIS